MLRRVAAFCRPLRPVLLLVSFPRSRSPVVGVLGLCSPAPPPPGHHPAIIRPSSGHHRPALRPLTRRPPITRQMPPLFVHPLSLHHPSPAPYFRFNLVKVALDTDVSSGGAAASEKEEKVFELVPPSFPQLTEAQQKTALSSAGPAGQYATYYHRADPALVLQYGPVKAHPQYSSRACWHVLKGAEATMVCECDAPSPKWLGTAEWQKWNGSEWAPALYRVEPCRVAQVS